MLYELAVDVNLTFRHFFYKALLVKFLNIDSDLLKRAFVKWIIAFVSALLLSFREDIVSDMDRN